MRLMPEVSGNDGDHVEVGNGAEWTTWSPRPGLQPIFHTTQEGLCITDRGDTPTCGCWERALPRLEKGKRYRLSVEFRAVNVRAPGASVWALLVQKKNDAISLPQDYLLQKSGEAGGWTTLQLDFTGDGSDRLALCLFYAWGNSGGQVIWRNARLSPVEEKAVPAVLRVAAVAGEQPPDAGVEVKIAYWTELVRRAASYGARLVCLPERINRGPSLYTGAPVGADIAFERFVQALSQTASECNLYICAGLHQDEGDAVYNTAVFIADTGETLGIYRKTHATIPESLFGGIAPGDSYPVFDTPIGKIAAMVCYDYHFPEVARVLALKGADLICLPNAGDGRENGRLWETVLRTRAVDNQVHIVSGVNSGRASIVSPSGSLLASTGKNFPGVAVAEINLGESMVAWNGHRVKGVYDKVRRYDTFSAITEHIWDVR